MAGKYSIKRDERLRERSAFEAIKRRGRQISGGRLALGMLPNSLSFNRIGVSISARVVPKSTRRHRLKRLVLEAYRLNRAGLTTGNDLAIRVRRAKGYGKFPDIEKELLFIFKRAGLIK